MIAIEEKTRELVSEYMLDDTIEGVIKKAILFGRLSALDDVENELPVPRIGGLFSDSHVDGQFYYKERVKNFISSLRSETSG